MSVSACPTFVPNSTSEAIMRLVHGYLTKRRKPWNLISQEWMLEKLREWYGVDISRSALNYNLAILRKEGLIDTQSRHMQDPVTGKMVFRVTLYKMTSALRRHFARLANYFKRCGWVPNVKQLAAGMIPAVGRVTNKEECHQAYLEERRRKPPKKRGRGR